MFITTKINPVLIFVFSCFSYLEQLDHDLFEGALPDLRIVSRLLSLGVSPDVRDSGFFNQTALQVAAFNNSKEAAQLLITHKADIEARDEDNKTFWAAYGNSKVVAQSLIIHIARMEARDKYIETPLFWAAYGNSKEVAQLLITLFTHKADIEARDKCNETPRFWAACGNSKKVAQLLITHKADIEARDN